MANEATVTSSLTINKGKLVYSSQPINFLTTVLGLKGPTPGALNVTIAGIDVDLSQLVTPGLYRIANIDDNNYLEYGIKDPGTGKFYVWGEIGPGETFVGRFSRNLGEAYTEPGTGTTAATNKVHLKATGASVTALLEAFER